MSNEDRFQELAHKALAKTAQPAEQAELRALIANDPKLKHEFEELGVEAALARETLPMMEDIERPSAHMPQPPMERLRREVGKVFKQPVSPSDELREMLERLERWAGGLRSGAGREKVLQWMNELRASLSEGLAGPAMLREQMPSMLREESTPYMFRKLMAEGEERRESQDQREADFEKRLSHLEERIEKTARVVQELGDDLRSCLEELRREKKR